MGRYVHGTQGFTYKYVYAAQPTNLNQLASWAGFGHQDEAFSISAQLTSRPWTLSMGSGH